MNKKADLETSDEQTFKGIIDVPDFDSGYSNMSNVMNKKYIDQKVDMKTTVTQKTSSRLQVPDYDNSSHNSADVVNLKYVNDFFLNKKTGGSLDNSITFNLANDENKRQIFGLGNPKFNSSAVNKSYVDGEVQKKVDSTNVVLRDGSNSINADLNMGNNKIISLEKPTNDSDAVNKKYFEDHVGESRVQSANAENKFKYIMDDPDAQL